MAVRTFMVSATDAMAVSPNQPRADVILLTPINSNFKQKKFWTREKFKNQTNFFKVLEIKYESRFCTASDAL
jgi:hypothetical protein